MTLLSMNRPPQEHTVKLLQKLRQRIPGLVLRTTFISGFPGKFPHIKGTAAFLAHMWWGYGHPGWVATLGAGGAGVCGAGVRGLRVVVP